MCLCDPLLPCSTATTRQSNCTSLMYKYCGCEHKYRGLLHTEMWVSVKITAIWWWECNFKFRNLLLHSSDINFTPWLRVIRRINIAFSKRQFWCGWNHFFEPRCAYDRIYTKLKIRQISMGRKVCTMHHQLFADWSIWIRSWKQRIPSTYDVHCIVIVLSVRVYAKIIIYFIECKHFCVFDHLLLSLSLLRSFDVQLFGNVLRI